MPAYTPGSAHVVVDRELCAGQGSCEIAGPRVYVLGEDYQVEVLLDPLPDAEAIEQAHAGTRVCPMMALSVEP